MWRRPRPSDATWLAAHVAIAANRAVRHFVSGCPAVTVMTPFGTVPIPPPRRVTLVLCTREGELLGALPPFDVPVPWWQEVSPLVAAVRERHAFDVVVLRLLRVGSRTPDGHRSVSYLAEVTGETSYGDLAPVDDGLADLLADHPLRLSYARPGGAAADLAWATDALQARGMPVAGRPVQMRTWNLSSVWRLPTSGGAAWLKVVPPFFAHEGRMIERLDPDVVAPLVATDGPRLLLDDVPGGDQYDAPVPLLLRMVSMLVGLQAAWVDRVAELVSLGLPDWRPDAFAAAAARALDASADVLEPEVRRRVEAIVDGLLERFTRIAAAGVPDTFVHGDFHPGNVVGTTERLALLDWGDCGIGHPLLDQAVFLERLTPEDATTVRATWASSWQRAVPGCDPARAAALLAPVAALRQTVIYQGFLDRIEPAERVYHEDDPQLWLRRAATVSDA
jgi:hypothetical protein